MQWVKALLMSGTPPAFWTHQHETLLARHHRPGSQPSQMQQPVLQHQQQQHKTQQQLQQHTIQQQQHMIQQQQQQVTQQQQHQQQVTQQQQPADPSDSSSSSMAPQSVQLSEGQAGPTAERASVPSSLRPGQDLGLKSLLQPPSMHSMRQQSYMHDAQAASSMHMPTGKRKGVASQAEGSVPAVQPLSLLPDGQATGDTDAAGLSGATFHAQRQQSQQQQQQQQQHTNEQMQRHSQNQPQSRAPALHSQYEAGSVQSSGGPSQSPEGLHQSPGSMYDYLEQLPGELVACRRILQYSFVLEYYWQATPNQARSVA